jgi:Spy/CpxP family protein refolding chaperone
MRTYMVVLAAVMLLLPERGSAQRPGAGSEGGVRPRGMVEQAYARALRERVRLSEDQIRSLAPVSQRFEERRRELLTQERETREELRREVAADTSANQARVAAALERLIGIQRQRIELVAEEQRALAEFMTPVQRARYHALQETVRRGAEEARARRLPGAAAPGRRPPPPR